MKKFLTSLFFFSSLWTTAGIASDAEPSHHIVRRAAFDIGSGQIKMQVSDVDVKTNTILNVLMTDSVYVGLREHLERSQDARLSPAIQQRAIHAISSLMKKANSFEPRECHAIATEALRLAQNSEDLVQKIKDETGVTVTIVSQEEEGILGFISAVSQANVDPDRAICWDLGGGSFQITTKCRDQYTVYQGRIGKTPMKMAMLKIQGKEEDPFSSPNPISKDQVIQASQWVQDHVKDIPDHLRQKLSHPDVVVLGVGINPLWGMSQSSEFSIQQIVEELENRLDLDDHAIRAKDALPLDRKEAFTHIVSNLVLAYGLMEALDIVQVSYVGTPGANAVGALLSPQYWKR